MRANGNKLEDNEGRCLGTFSCHWAACAAMIRLRDPNFRSLGGDRPEDLAVEATLALSSQHQNTGDQNG